MSGAVVNPVVAVVGRPNVGKSTLVNRILGRREAIVEERPGVTRDRKAVDAEWQGRCFTLLDTGGWSASRDDLDAKVSAQAERAVREADAVLLVVDASVGPTADDEQVARVLHSADVPVMVVANKVDHAAQADSVWELLGLGLGTPHQVSALHGRGTGDLLEELITCLDAAEASTEGDEPAEGAPDPAGSDLAAAAAEAFSVVLVGRPNAGKSTLFNRLTGEDRAIVHDLPGTTRDVLEESFNLDGVPIVLNDTAGLRETTDPVETLGVERSSRALESADAVVLVFDASRPLLGNDETAAERVRRAARPTIIALNKRDLPHAVRANDVHDLAPGAPVVHTAATREDVSELRQALRHVIGLAGGDGGLALVASVRHQEALTRARNELAGARRAVADDEPSDFVSIGVRGAVDALGEITGDSATQDLLDVIFSKFCIGK